MKNLVVPIIVTVILLIFVFIFMTGGERTFSTDSDNRICEAYNDLVQWEIHGIVEKAFVDEKNHGFKKVEINSNGELIILFLDFDGSGLFESLEQGDSIAKFKNTNLVSVFNNTNEQQFELDFGCNPH